MIFKTHIKIARNDGMRLLQFEAGCFMLNAMFFRQNAQWYVYELADPLTGKPFYVGKGKGKRIDDHERETLKGVCSKKCNKIRSITKLGQNILKRKVASFWCEQAAYDYETDLIEFYGLPNLTNILRGGQVAFERRVKEKKARTEKPLCPIELLKRNPWIIKDWAELTDCGKFRVEAVLTGKPLQDAISKMAAKVYNDAIPKVIKEALAKSGGELTIGSA